MDRHSWLRLKMICFATLQRRMSGAMHCGRVCLSTVMRPSCLRAHGSSPASGLRLAEPPEADSAVLSVEAMVLDMRHHPQGAPRFRFARNRYHQFVDDLRGDAFQTCKVALGK
jgi:hypothetical protein